MAVTTVCEPDCLQSINRTLESLRGQGRCGCLHGQSIELSGGSEGAGQVWGRGRVTGYMSHHRI